MNQKNISIIVFINRQWYLLNEEFIYGTCLIRFLGFEV